MGAVLGLLVLRVALGVHGFSLPEWHGVIDGSRPREILVGRSRPIRGDDWAVILPMILSQRAHAPPFPVVNRLVGYGQNMITHYAIPVLHPITLFRPQVWGYFLGADVGLAWHWGVLASGLYLGWFWLLLAVARGRVAVAALGALVLLVTPFVQFWSLNSAPGLAFTALWSRASVGFVLAETAASVVGWGLLAAWSALGLFFYLYPPYEIPLVALGAAMAVGCVLRASGAGARECRRLEKVLTAGLLLGLCALAVTVWWRDARDALRLVLDTEYPGKRLATGGGYDAVSLLRHDLLLPFWVTRWERMGNVCEAASAVFLFPVVGAAAVAAWAGGRVRLDPVGVALLAVAAGAVFWMSGTGHPSLARWTPLRFVPSTRMLGALVPADVALAVWFVSADRAVRPGRALVWILTAAWAALLLWVGWRLRQMLGEGRLPHVLAATVAVATAGHLVLRQRWQALGWLAAVSAAATLSFNPVVRGGSRFILRNPLSQRIVEIDREWGRSTCWAAWGNAPLANLSRALGLRSINGVHVYPQTPLWRELDPRGERHEQWNRYANVVFAMSPDPAAVSIVSPQPDAVIVTVAPANPALRRLGVTHAIVAGPDPPPAAVAGLRRIARVGRHVIYQLADPRAR